MKQIAVTKIIIHNGKEHRRDMMLPESVWNRIVGGDNTDARFELREEKKTVTEVELIEDKITAEAVEQAKVELSEEIERHLTDYSDAELKVKAKELKIKGSHLMKRDKLIEAISKI